MLWLCSFVIDFESTVWDDRVENGLQFTMNTLLQLPVVLMSFVHYFTPALDQMLSFLAPVETWKGLIFGSFMTSLEWVDRTYRHKHRNENPADTRDMFYPNLVLYSTAGRETSKNSPLAKVLPLMIRYGKRAAVSLVVYGSESCPA